MIQVLDAFPRVKCTFNITPSLIYQLLDISENETIDDTYLNLSIKDSSMLTEDEKLFILKNFFSIHPFGVSGLPRYQDLFKRRGEKVSNDPLTGKISKFSESDLRDIQVLFNLAWCGFTLREKDPLVGKLIKKGEGYTEEEKRELLKRQKEVVSSILPAYKKMQDEGKIEISTTPFYHPILPLLLNDGFNYNEDAAWHVKKAIDLYKKVFGRKPAGMWPAEGSVSRSAAELMAKRGIKWIASDEGVLMESFKGSSGTRENLIFRPFNVGNWPDNISIVFRDPGLSNAISFEYANVPGAKASHDFFRNITAIQRWLGKESYKHIVSVILDGENPWLYYKDGGKGFLTGVYGRLESSPNIEAVTINGFLKKNRERKQIKKLASGSWINHNFRKWIGSPQKDKAWESLGKVRRDLLDSGKLPEDAMEELYIAESSDWFWWYDEFGTELNFVFDDLFRMHLKNAYRLSGRKIPGYLDEPIHGTGVDLPGHAPGEMARAN